jgi:hypothetical protein
MEYLKVLQYSVIKLRDRGKLQIVDFPSFETRTSEIEITWITAKFTWSVIMKPMSMKMIVNKLDLIMEEIVITPVYSNGIHSSSSLLNHQHIFIWMMHVIAEPLFRLLYRVTHFPGSPNTKTSCFTILTFLLHCGETTWLCLFSLLSAF